MVPDVQVKKLAMAVAVKNTKLQPRYFHGAVLLDGDKVVAAAANAGGCNNYLPRRRYSLHAEERVLRKVPGWRDRESLTLVVVRVNKLGRLKNSRPCKRCTAFITRAGINRVLYSTNDEGGP